MRLYTFTVIRSAVLSISLAFSLSFSFAAEEVNTSVDTVEKEDTFGSFTYQEKLKELFTAVWSYVEDGTVPAKYIETVEAAYERLSNKSRVKELAGKIQEALEEGKRTEPLILYHELLQRVTDPEKVSVYAKKYAAYFDGLQRFRICKIFTKTPLLIFKDYTLDPETGKPSLVMTYAGKDYTVKESDTLFNFLITKVNIDDEKVSVVCRDIDALPRRLRLRSTGNMSYRHQLSLHDSMTGRTFHGYFYPDIFVDETGSVFTGIAKNSAAGIDLVTLVDQKLVKVFDQDFLKSSYRNSLSADTVLKEGFAGKILLRYALYPKYHRTYMPPEAAKDPAAFFFEYKKDPMSALVLLKEGIEGGRYKDKDKQRKFLNVIKESVDKLDDTGAWILHQAAYLEDAGEIRDSLMYYYVYDKFSGTDSDFFLQKKTMFFNNYFFRFTVTGLESVEIPVEFKSYARGSHEDYHFQINYHSNSFFKDVGESMGDYRITDFERKIVTRRVEAINGTLEDDLSELVIEKRDSSDIILNLGESYSPKYVYPAYMADIISGRMFCVFLEPDVVVLANDRIIPGIVTYRGESSLSIEEFRDESSVQNIYTTKDVSDVVSKTSSDAASFEGYPPLEEFFSDLFDTYGINGLQQQDEDYQFKPAADVLDESMVSSEAQADQEQQVSEDQQETPSEPAQEPAPVEPVKQKKSITFWYYYFMGSVVLLLLIVGFKYHGAVMAFFDPKKRRKAVRYKLEIPLKYRIQNPLESEASYDDSKIVDISVTGIAFKTLQKLPKNRAAEFVISDNNIHESHTLYGITVNSTFEKSGFFISTAQFKPLLVLKEREFITNLINTYNAPPDL